MTYSELRSEPFSRLLERKNISRESMVRRLSLVQGVSVSVCVSQTQVVLDEVRLLVHMATATQTSCGFLRCLPVGRKPNKVEFPSYMNTFIVHTSFHLETKESPKDLLIADSTIPGSVLPRASPALPCGLLLARSPWAGWTCDQTATRFPSHPACLQVFQNDPSSSLGLQEHPHAERLGGGGGFLFLLCFPVVITFASQSFPV